MVRSEVYARWLRLLHVLRIRKRIRMFWSRHPWNVLPGTLAVAPHVWVPVVAAVCLIAYIAVSLIRSHPTTIEDISVPAALQARGYTGTVVAQRLRDAILALQSDAVEFSGDAARNDIHDTKSATQGVDDDKISGVEDPKVATLPTFPKVYVPNESVSPINDFRKNQISVTVPVIGISTTSLYSLGAKVIRQHDVSGDIVVLHSGFQFTAREDGTAVARHIVGADIDAVIQKAAVAILERRYPLVAVAGSAHRNLSDGILEANDVLNKRSVVDSPVAELRLLRATLLLRSGRYKDAATDFAAVSAPDALALKALTGLAYTRYFQGDYAGGIRAFRRLIALQTGNHQKRDGALHFGLANALYRSGDRLGALAEYNSAIKASSGTDALAYNGLGNVLRDEHHGDEAEKAYREAIKNNGHNAVYHNNLGALLESASKVTEAIAECKEATRWDPNSVVAHYNLALAYEDAAGLGDFAKAKHELGLSLAINPRFALARVRLAHIMEREGNLHDALAVIKTGVSLDPTNAHVRNALGIVFEGKNRLPEAEEAYKIAIRLDPKFAAPLVNLAKIQSTRSPPGAQQLQLVLRAGRLEPSNANVLYAIWTIASHSNNPKAAIDPLKRAVDLYRASRDIDQQAQALTLLGDVYGKAGYKKEADAARAATAALIAKGAVPLP